MKRLREIIPISEADSYSGTIEPGRLLPREFPFKPLPRLLQRGMRHLLQLYPSGAGD